MKCRVHISDLDSKELDAHEQANDAVCNERRRVFTPQFLQFDAEPLFYRAEPEATT